MPSLDFIIIGAQKAGTSFLHRHLAQHPSVVMPEREASFFEEASYQPDLTALAELFPDRKGEGQRFGIKRPGYLAKPECAERIHRHFPEARITLIVRNPVDRLISAYFHYMRYRHLPLCPLAAGLEALLAGRYSAYPKAWELIEFGKYFTHLRRYSDYFPRSQIQVLFLEEVQRQPEQQLQKLCSFIGIDGDFYRNKQLEVKNEGSYSLWETALWWAFHSVFYHQNSATSRLSIRPFLSEAEPRGRQFLHRLLSMGGKEEGSVSLPETLRERLHRLYDEDVRQLYAWLDLPAGEDPFNWYPIGK